MSTARIVGMGHALPAAYSQQSVWDGFFAEHFRDVPLAEQLFTRSGVRTRHTVANPVHEDVSRWGTAARMERYLAEALPLGKDAVATALADAGLAAADVGLFAVASCTGYVTPGVDIRLARDLGMSDRVRRLFVGHMGCYAALPGLGTVADFTAARDRPSVLLCLELTSLHIQPPTTDVDQVVAHALFADAAAAVVLEPSARPGFEVVDVVAQTDVSTAEYMTWDVTDLGFRMGLSPRVPAVLAKHVRGVVDDLLGAHGLAAADVDGWAVHPGGRRILEVVQRRLELTDGALEHSYGVLRDHGNCSSATVLLVLERMRAAGVVAPGRYLVALAFGPGLTLYATLLRAV
ncbi:MAG TPA: 3-oxoacyl-[acyl-carrier-protein] synthase III C-terminal domain-containing protein [Mycobacteriales bacterium]|nr:3-oxoacyl-[acyl-carrier-protein] synthase III C-terminal domain-containing protein [Mycobacteriales bacterium]